MFLEVQPNHVIIRFCKYWGNSSVFFFHIFGEGNNTGLFCDLFEKEARIKGKLSGLTFLSSLCFLEEKGNLSLFLFQ